jgi:hypothetical protein
VLQTALVLVVIASITSEGPRGEVGTVPSTTASTFSSRAICGMVLCVSLYCTAEVREITRIPGSFARSVMISSFYALITWRSRRLALR